MSYVEAVYRHGVFEPLHPVDLQEEQRVRLSVEPAGPVALKEWLERVKKRRDEIFNRQGCLPDSTLDIAEDRKR